MPHEHGGDFICIDGHVSVDQQPFVKAIVNGSKQIRQDLLADSESVLDPDGDKAYEEEIRKHGQTEAMRMCSSPLHRGNPWLPEARFSGKDRYCLACRGEMEHLRRTRTNKGETPPKRRIYNSRTTARPRNYGYKAKRG